MAGSAVVLLSGGIDSATAAAMARRKGWTLYALTVRYGQTHAVEVQAARRLAQSLGMARHVELDVNLGAFGGSSLVGEGPVPKDRPDTGEIPTTYVPARNTVLLSLALAWAEVLGAEHIVIGVNALDYSGYPDCRPEFISAFEYLATLATKAGVSGKRLQVWAPLQHLSKAAIIRLAQELGIDFSMTHSCYDPGIRGEPCGRCDSCHIRAKGFAEAGIPDPATLPSTSRRASEGA
jgi:7-cyano-7-deazaguanine synthase